MAQVVDLPASLLAGGSGPAGAPLAILKIADLGKAVNDVAFCGDWLALALNGATKARALPHAAWRAPAQQQL